LGEYMRRFFAVILLLVFFTISTLAAATITAVRIPTSIAENGGTGTTGYPYAIFIQISGWTSGASSQAYLKLYSSSNNEYMWNGASWSNSTTYSSANQPVVNIDASGNWSGWIYAKHNTSVGSSPSVRAAKVGATSTNLTSAQSFTILNMVTTGGWIVAQSTTASNKGIAAYSAGNIVGTYRTEDNGITEGYSYGSGGFKIAVPAGLIDSITFFNDDGTYYSSLVGPWSVTAGTDTDINNVISVASGSATLSPILWKATTPTNIQLIFKPTTDTVHYIYIIKPISLNWNTSNISVTPVSSTTVVHGDTIQISNLSLNGPLDSVVVTLGSVTAIDSTSSFSLMVQSSKEGTSFGQIAQLPVISTYGSPCPMSQVKEKQADGTFTLLGKRVVVQGVVTVENEFGGPSYLQDGTAGIAVYDSSVTNNVNRGDEVVLLGVVTSYNGIFELQPCSILEMTSEGNLFDTLTVSMAEIKAQNQKAFEPYECRLIRVNNITSVIQTNGSPATTWATTGSGTNYDLLSGSDTLEIRISSKTNIANTAVPTSKFDLVGVLGQFNTFYQIMPRSYDDIVIEGAGPRITSGVPYESNLTATSITFHFTTDVSGTAIVNYGLTPTYGNTFTDTTKATNHSVTITGLKPATIYNIRLGSTNLGGTTYTANYIVSTASQTSTGEINVYFNKSVSTAYASHENAQGSVDLTARLITRINAATYSIDACLYNLSGSVGASIAQAFVYAKSNRNVKIRVISEKSSTDNAPYSTLTNAGITFINDGFDAINGGAGLMHNKFVVFDNRDTTSDTDDWTWTGSWNQSESGTNSDLQNSIEIQDKAMANAYTMEFNEMWGSSGDTPNSSTTRFGARKINNTPHYFSINGIPVELYFSPSDGTNNHIIQTLNKAQASVDFCLLTFTRNDIANALIAKKSAGLRVHGVVDNRTDSGSEVDSLNAHHIDTRIDINTGYLHHKYAIIDAEGGNAANQYVITGSHNWSSNAEYDNDENTLIIQSNRIANLYLQEFAARYKESGGKDTIVTSTSVREIDNERPNRYSVSQNYPNPFNPTTSFEITLPFSGFVSIKVFDILGREVTTLVNEVKPFGVYQVTWNASTLTSGVYFYKVQIGNFTNVRKALLLK
jgi:phosphatidylserine/phosphatidylglycerophosphate/cardiolipin synthase-like enzyme